MDKNERITASEALFGFGAWLTCREEASTFGANHDASPMVALLREWVEENRLPDPREGVYPGNITQPPHKHLA
jgi:hypothetical protein